MPGSRPRGNHRRGKKKASVKRVCESKSGQRLLLSSSRFLLVDAAAALCRAGTWSAEALIDVSQSVREDFVLQKSMVSAPRDARDDGSLTGGCEDDVVVTVGPECVDVGSPTFKYVLHISPSSSFSSPQQLDERLFGVLSSALMIAGQLGCASICLPPLHTLAHPLNRVVVVMFHAVLYFFNLWPSSALREVYFALGDVDGVREVFVREFERRFGPKAVFRASEWEKKRRGRRREATSELEDS